MAIDKAGAAVVAEKILKCLKWHYGAEANDPLDTAAKQLIAELIWHNSTLLIQAKRPGESIIEATRELASRGLEA